MSIEITFYPLDVSFVEEGTILFGITQDKRRIAIIDSAYLPYFIIVKEDFDKLLKLCEQKSIPIEHKQEEGNLVKLFVKPKNFIHITKIAREISTRVYNCDIPLKKRYWIDRKFSPI
ncbi:MAG: hypothetical protein QW063_02280, partial [Candidatus Nanoarchaeia archaeon]